MKAAKIKKPDLTAVNELDLKKAMDQLKSNNAKLTDLNLNNHQEVTIEVLEDVAKALNSNTSLKHLHLANTQMTDKTAKVLLLVYLQCGILPLITEMVALVTDCGVGIRQYTLECSFGFIYLHVSTF